MAESRPLLEVRGLEKHFPIVEGFFNEVVGQVRAVDGVSFVVEEGECLGLVGESGSGKTTVGRCILRALEPTRGEILFRVGEGVVDAARLPAAELKALRRHMQLIFQDPYASLNPRMTVLDIIGEPLLVNGMGDRRQREERVRELLSQVGLDPAHMQRYPHAFSGGQRQRIGIARALALRPRGGDVCGQHRRAGSRRRAVLAASAPLCPGPAGRRPGAGPDTAGGLRPPAGRGGRPGQSACRLRLPPSVRVRGGTVPD